MIEKVMKRGGGLKLFIKPHSLPNGKEFMVLADFTDEKERKKVRGIKATKGSKVAITDDFCTAGYSALSNQQACIITSKTTS